MPEIKKDEFEEICNELEKVADEKMSREIRESQSYNQGYKQACEDYFKQIRQRIREKE